MKLKQRPTDFKVRELLLDGVLQLRGPHRVYRVSKSKRTSFEAAQTLGRLAGVAAGEVSMAGLKDRQGVTWQYMSIERGRPVHHRRPELTIEPAGWSASPIGSKDSAGNAFEIVVRDLVADQLAALRRGTGPVRERGIVNYFDEQRFGNLQHRQGWLALELLKGRTEQALKALLCRSSSRDGDRARGMKTALQVHWGDWRECREIAGRFGAHHSVFEHLRRNAGDFAGAFRYVASRTRLIHLYAYQSHLWNRAVARLVERRVPAAERFTIDSIEGPLVFAKNGLPLDPAWDGCFPLPGPELEGVEHPEQRKLLAELLAADGVPPERFRIRHVPGFAFKSEPRRIVVRPFGLRVRPAEPDPLNEGKKLVRVSFELPRGSYATLVVRTLVPERASAPVGRRGDGGRTRRRPGPGPRRQARGRGRREDTTPERGRSSGADRRGTGERER